MDTYVELLILPESPEEPLTGTKTIWSSINHEDRLSWRGPA